MSAAVPVAELAATIEQQLRAAGTPERAAQEQRYLKSDLDVLAAGVAGALVQRFPELNATLDRWARDPDFWIRRSALLALLEPLRAGGDFERFAGYADAMPDERRPRLRRDTARSGQVPQPGAACGAARRAREQNPVTY